MTSSPVTTWLVLGSSPSAPRFYDALWPAAWRMTTITTNSGWQMMLVADTCLPTVPDYYFLSDPVAIELHARAARYMQKRGTTIIAKQSAAQGLGIGLDDSQILRVPLADYAERGDWTPGQYLNGRCSGAICLQHAVNAGAREIYLVGMDGYASQGKQIVRDSFDGRVGKSSGKTITDSWYAPLIQSIVAATPHIRYIVCGKPRYELAGSNVSIINDPNQLAPQSAA
jgi:hypothetical protein